MNALMSLIIVVWWRQFLLPDPAVIPGLTQASSDLLGDLS